MSNNDHFRGVRDSFYVSVNDQSRVATPKKWRPFPIYLRGFASHECILNQAKPTCHKWLFTVLNNSEVAKGQLFKDSAKSFMLQPGSIRIPASPVLVADHRSHIHVHGHEGPPWRIAENALSLTELANCQNGAARFSQQVVSHTVLTMAEQERCLSRPENDEICMDLLRDGENALRRVAVFDD